MLLYTLAGRAIKIFLLHHDYQDRSKTESKQIPQEIKGVYIYIYIDEFVVIPNGESRSSILFICTDHPNTQNKLCLPAGNFTNFVHQQHEFPNFATHNKGRSLTSYFPTNVLSSFAQETLRARHCSKSMVLSDPRMSCVDQKCPHRWRLPQCLALAVGAVGRGDTLIRAFYI